MNESRFAESIAKIRARFITKLAGKLLETNPDFLLPLGDGSVAGVR
jgi:hypothetical protein